jgi:hypothetical protein
MIAMRNAAENAIRHFSRQNADMQTRLQQLQAQIGLLEAQVMANTLPLLNPNPATPVTVVQYKSSPISPLGPGLETLNQRSAFVHERRVEADEKTRADDRDVYNPHFLTLMRRTKLESILGNAVRRPLDARDLRARIVGCTDISEQTRPREKYNWKPDDRIVWGDIK